MASLLMALYDSGRTTFATAEAAQTIGLTVPLTSSLLHKARKRGLVSQLKRGLFVIVPPELGSSAEYARNPYLVARYLVDDAPYFLSHAASMELHRMVTQPQFVIFVSSAKRIPSQTLHGTQFRFVLLKSEVFFGTTKHWVTKQESIETSDLERTILDGLRHPEYYGGITDVAKGLWMRHDDLSLVRNAFSKLITGAKTRELENNERLQRKFFRVWSGRWVSNQRPKLGKLAIQI
jgi:predicted transcriptional regulator of viral defense system